MLSSYRATERELKVLLENEAVLSQTRGRMQEVLAYGMAGVTETQIDDVIDEIEESVEVAEGRLDATRDLEKAGRRRERASEKESLQEQLGEFDEAGSSTLEEELADFEETPGRPREKEQED